MSECICEGNWRKIIEESEPLLDKLFVREKDGGIFRFVGVLHASDDYYYCMANEVSGKTEMLSCVGSIENYGYLSGND